MSQGERRFIRAKAENNLRSEINSIWGRKLRERHCASLLLFTRCVSRTEATSLAASPLLANIENDSVDQISVKLHAFKVVKLCTLIMRQTDCYRSYWNYIVKFENMLSHPSAV